MNKVTTVGIDLAKRVFAQYISALRSRRCPHSCLLNCCATACEIISVGIVFLVGSTTRHSVTHNCANHPKEQ